MADFQSTSSGQYGLVPVDSRMQNMDGFDGADSDLQDRDIMFLCTSVPPQDLCNFAVMYLGVTRDQIRFFVAEASNNPQDVSYKCIEWWRNSYQGPDARRRLHELLLRASNTKMRGLIRTDQFVCLDPVHQEQIGECLCINKSLSLIH